MSGSRGKHRVPLEQLARASYREMALYASNRAPVALDLSDNTSLFGMPPAAGRELAAAGPETFTRYPSHYGGELKRALAARLGVGPDQIVTGCGSDDVLDSAIRAFAEPGDAIAYPWPTFAMLPYFAHMNGLLPRPVPLLGPERGHDVDVDGLLEGAPRIVYVCTPNNPTGTLASPAAIERLLGEATGLVLLDEAYVEFSGESLAGRAAAEGRLLVVRTLSKALGMAGLRVGYAVGAPELVATVELSRGPYKVSALAERAATAALREDGPWVDEHVRRVIAARERFVAALRERGLEPLPTAANFVLVPVPDAAAVAAALRERGIAVRPFPALAGIGDAVRISVGPFEVMEQALPALWEVLPCR